MPEQYEYKFIQVKIPNNEFGTEYINIIREHARQGWRFVQALGPTKHEWFSSYYDLIFERKME